MSRRSWRSASTGPISLAAWSLGTEAPFHLLAIDPPDVIERLAAASVGADRDSATAVVASSHQAPPFRLVVTFSVARARTRFMTSRCTIAATSACIDVSPSAAITRRLRHSSAVRMRRSIFATGSPSVAGLLVGIYRAYHAYSPYVPRPPLSAVSCGWGSRDIGYRCQLTRPQSPTALRRPANLQTSELPGTSRRRSPKPRIRHRRHRAARRAGHRS
jgi:hypothetical protein